MIEAAGEKKKTSQCLLFADFFFRASHQTTKRTNERQPSQQLLDDIFADVDLEERGDEEEGSEEATAEKEDGELKKKKTKKSEDGDGGGRDQNQNQNGAGRASEWDTPMPPGDSTLGRAAATGSPPSSRSRNGGDAGGLIPWHLPPPSLRSHLLRLHNEVLSFWAFSRPTRAETLARAAAAQRLRSLVSAIWPGDGVAVEVFGSSATGLALPGSDVDVVVRGAEGGGDAATRLRALGAALARSGVARDLQLITRARVPLAKYVDAATGLRVDASFDAENGPATARRAVRALGALPAARPLLAVLKASLAQRGLSEVYTGGLGSYALLVMVVAFLQGHRSRYYGGGSGGEQQQQQRKASAAKKRGSSSSSPSASASPLEPCLGTLLLDFCALFGRQLDYDRVGVRMLMEDEDDEDGEGEGERRKKQGRKDAPRSNGGVFFAKTEQQRRNSPRPGALTVLDPCDPSNDLSGGSFHADRVRAAFDHMGSLLAAPLPEGAVGGGARCSLLARCIRVDGALRGRESPFFATEEAVGGSKGEEEYDEGEGGRGGGRGPPSPLPRSSPPGKNKKRKGREEGQEEDESERSKKSRRKREDLSSFSSFPRGGREQQQQQSQHYRARWRRKEVLM